MPDKGRACVAHGLRAQFLILGTVWQQDCEAAGHSVPTVWTQRQASVGAQFPFSVLLKSGSPTHRIVLFTFRVLHAQLNLSGNTLTDMFRGVSPRWLQKQSS